MHQGGDRAPLRRRSKRWNATGRAWRGSKDGKGPHECWHFICLSRCVLQVSMPVGQTKPPLMKAEVSSDSVLRTHCRFLLRAFISC